MSEEHDREDRPPRAGTQEVLDRIPVLSWMRMRVAESELGTYAVELDAHEHVLNMMGNVHGGVLATLIDHTGGHAAGALLGRGGPTGDMHIRYLSPARVGPVKAVARILKEGRRLIVVDVQVYDGNGTLTTIGTLTVAPQLAPVTVSPD